MSRVAGDLRPTLNVQTNWTCSSPLLDSSFDNQSAAGKRLCVSVHQTERGHGKFEQSSAINLSQTKAVSTMEKQTNKQR